MEENAERIVSDIEKKLEEESKRLEKYREEETARILREIDRVAESNYSRAVEEGLKILSKMIYGREASSS